MCVKFQRDSDFYTFLQHVFLLEMKIYYSYQNINRIVISSETSSTKIDNNNFAHYIEYRLQSTAATKLRNSNFSRSPKSLLLRQNKSGRHFWALPFIRWHYAPRSDFAIYDCLGWTLTHRMDDGWWIRGKNASWNNS